MWHTLPRLGGADDQPAGLLRRMTVAYNYWLAHDAYRRMDPMKRTEWVNENEGQYNLVQNVKEMKEVADAIV